MEAMAVEAGGRTEVRDGWSIVSGFSSPQAEREVCRRAVGFADTSHLSKLEVQAEPGELHSMVRDLTGTTPQLGQSIHREASWWCPLNPGRLLVISPPADARELSEELQSAVDRVSGNAALTDVTSVFGSLTLVGPAARETIARFCALDLRPEVTPVGGPRPGSIARQPGVLVRQAAERYLLLFGWAIGQYMWTVVQDAAAGLGGAPVGADSLEALRASDEGLAARA